MRRKSTSMSRNSEERKYSIDLSKVELNEETIQKALKEVNEELRIHFLSV